MGYSSIIKYFFSVSVITAGLIYLAKIVIDKIAEGRLEKYKNSLLQDTEIFRTNLNLEAEKFKHELNTTLTEHQIKYSKLYEERGQIIRQTYNLLLDLEVSLVDLTTKFQGPEWTFDTERDKKATQSIQALLNHLEENRIFFSDSLCKKIESILEDSRKITADMFMAKQNATRNENHIRRGINLTETELLSPGDTWTELETKVQNEIKAARLNLAEEFRVLIGVTQ